MTINCPHCQESLEAAGVLAGSEASCPTCDGRFEVPETPAITRSELPPALPVENDKVSLFCQQCGAKLTMDRQFQEVSGECPSCMASFVVNPGDCPSMATLSAAPVVIPDARQSVESGNAERIARVLNAPKNRKYTFFTPFMIGAIIGGFVLGMLRANGIYLGGLPAVFVTFIFAALGSAIGSSLQEATLKRRRNHHK